MIVATLAALGSTEEVLVNRTSAMATIKTYRECCIQCLVLSNYIKPGLYTLETIFIYMESEFLVNKDDQVQSFLLVGNAARLALRMGLHRDSTKVRGNITPFQAEIRRRLWHHLLQLDLLTSFHIGLPGTVQAIDSDTRLPGNFQDEDFDEDSNILPPSRPDSELTPMSYSICKSRLCIVAGRIVALANRLSLPEYQEVMNLDRDLQTAHQKVPPVFILDPKGPPVTDSAANTIRRFSLAILFQKSRCMLHRKHLMRAGNNPEFAFSDRVSLEAAMELLHCQSMVHEAALPGGQLSRDRWFLSSLSMHDFLLAAMIVYLSLSHGTGSTEARQEKIDALDKSRVIWNQKWTVSAESKKAAMVLEIMLKKVQSGTGQVSASSLVPSSSFGGTGLNKIDGVSKLSLNGIKIFIYSIAQLTNSRSNDRLQPNC
jgi:Fungal specific transcription factor domain